MGPRDACAHSGADANSSEIRPANPTWPVAPNPPATCRILEIFTPSSPLAMLCLAPVHQTLVDRIDEVGGGPTARIGSVASVIALRWICRDDLPIAPVTVDVVLHPRHDGRHHVAIAHQAIQVAQWPAHRND